LARLVAFYLTQKKSAIFSVPHGRRFQLPGLRFWNLNLVTVPQRMGSANIAKTDKPFETKSWQLFPTSQ
jgi:hypothetical protein